MRRLLTALALTLITSLAQASFPADGSRALEASKNNPEYGFMLDSAVSHGDHVKVTLSIAPGFSLYKASLKFISSGAEVAPGSMPEGLVKEDPALGKIEVYQGSTVIEIPLVVDRALVVKFQGCLDTGICFEEQKRTIQIEGHLSKHIEIDELNSLWWFAIAGVLLSFTPCVLPTLPLMLHAISGERRGRLSQASLGLTYSLFSALSYAGLGVLIGFLGAQYDLRAALQAPIPILVVSSMLMVLAAINSGFRLPLVSSLRLDFVSGKLHQVRGGTFPGAGLMGVVSTLMLSPCVTAPLAGVMLHLAQSGSPAYAALCLFILGLGMSFPMIVLALGGKRFIPKSGPWLAFVKEASAMLLMGAALVNLSRLLTGPQTLILIGAASLALSAYAKSRIPAVAKGALRACLVFVLLCYGFLSICGGINGQDDWRKPIGVPASLVDITLSEPDPLHKWIGHGRHAVVMVSAQWCLNCKILESRMAAANLKAVIPGIFWAKLDITSPSQATSTWLSDRDLFGPPALLFFDRGGREVHALRVIGTPHADEVLGSIQRLSELP